MNRGMREWFTDCWIQSRKNRRMPSRVILVYEKVDLLNAISAALTGAGYAVARFTDPRAALTRLKTSPFGLLITRVEFKRHRSLRRAKPP